MAHAKKSYLQGGRVIINGMPFELLGLQMTYENRPVASSSGYMASGPSDYMDYHIQEVQSLSQRVFLKLGLDENELYERMKYMPTPSSMRGRYGDIFGWASQKKVRIELTDGYGEMRVHSVQQARLDSKMITCLEVEADLEWHRTPNKIRNETMGNGYYTSSNTYTVNTNTWSTASGAMQKMGKAMSQPKPKRKTDMEWLDERINAMTSPV